MRLMKAALIVALAALLPLSAASAAEFTLRVGSVAPEGTPWYKIVKKLKDIIEDFEGTQAARDAEAILEWLG